jgi:hypothetical protein
MDNVKPVVALLGNLSELGLEILNGHRGRFASEHELEAMRCTLAGCGLISNDD